MRHVDVNETPSHAHDHGEHSPSRPETAPCVEIPPLGQPRPPRRRCQCKGHKQDCCEQLLELLRSVPGLEIPQLHKPKQSPGAKLKCLCDCLPVADALIPAMIRLFRRFEAGEPARNPYEDRLYGALSSLSTPRRDAMRHAFDVYRQLPAHLRDCIFDDRLGRKVDAEELTPSDVLTAIAQEGLTYFADKFFENSFGVEGPGQVRLWDVTWAPPPNGSQALQKYTGPWPWLTAIRPNPMNFQEFGSRTSFRPVPNGAHQWQSYQIAQNCVAKPNPSKPGELIVNCTPKTPPPPAPGSLFGAFCEGGEDYTQNGQCVQFAMVEPGATIALRGFNFITPKVKVSLRKADDHSINKLLEGPVFGDLETPQKDADGHVIVDERVRDAVMVTVPSENPKQPGAPLPAGLYEVKVIVDNVLSAQYNNSIPPTLESNVLLLQVEPDPTISFSLWSDHGHCYEETDGLGADEIWFDAFVGRIVPKDLATGAQPVEPVRRVEFDRGAWDDMDSGEGSGSYSTPIWTGPIGLGGMVVAGLLGFEVDNEAAARQQIEDGFEAFVFYLEQTANIALGLEGVAGALLAIADVALLTAIYVMAAIAVFVLVVGIFWAIWAPADRIAIDIFGLDGRTAWWRTDPTTDLPPAQSNQYEEVTASHNPLPKRPDAGTASMIYVSEHRYVTPEDGEDSDYGITFQLARR